MLFCNASRGQRPEAPAGYSEDDGDALSSQRLKAHRIDSSESPEGAAEVSPARKGGWQFLSSRKSFLGGRVAQTQAGKMIRGAPSSFFEGGSFF